MRLRNHRDGETTGTLDEWRLVSSSGTRRGAPRHAVEFGGPSWVNVPDVGEPCEHPLDKPLNASSWSRNDHEDGGPTIQLPAAGAAAPFRRLTPNSICLVVSQIAKETCACRTAGGRPFRRRVPRDRSTPAQALYQKPGCASSLGLRVAKGTGPRTTRVAVGDRSGRR
jgi:hypothetical protein